MKIWETPYVFPGGLELRNRLVFAPISTMSSSNIGLLSDKEIQFYKSRAQNMGLVILGSANVSKEGKAYDRNVTISHDAAIPNLKTYNKEIHETGAKSIIQLYHGGSATQFLPSQKDVYTVSTFFDERYDKEKQYHELTETEILQTINDFGKAIHRAIRAGFDGIEIHGGNPFLVQQFLSPRTNRREDFWGGNAQKRFRFLEALLKLANEIKGKTASPSFVIGVRLAMEENTADGITFQETCRLAEKISKLSVDYIHFNQNDLFEIQNEEIKVSVIEKGIEHSICLIGNGSVDTEKKIEEALGIVPLISIARPLVLQPAFPIELNLPFSMGDVSKEKLLIPDGLWQSLIKSSDWFLGINH